MQTILSYLYVPFGYLFRILFEFIGNYGLALLIYALFFRLILVPTAVHQQKGSAKQVRLQPKLKRIRDKYQDYAPAEKNQKIQEETTALYQSEGYNAMSAGCLPLIIQLPILWGLYGVIRNPLTYVLNLSKDCVTALTSAVKSITTVSGNATAYLESKVIPNINEIAYKFPDTFAKYGAEFEKIKNFDFAVFGIDLSAIPSFSTLTHFGSATNDARILLLIPILSFLTSLATSILSVVRQNKNNPNMENKQMMGCTMLMMPLMSLWFTFQFPAGMGMYWILSNLFAFCQTLILGHVYAPRKTIARLMVDETIYRRSYENTKKITADTTTED